MGGRLVRRFYYKYFARNLLYSLQLRARAQSADYVEQHMADAIMFEERDDLLTYCLEQAPTDGMLLEFGVEKGGSIRALAAATPRTIHGFDSFEGLPEDWSGTAEKRGKFSLGGRLPPAPANVRLHKGWFDQVLPGFLDANAGPVAFVHVDCDIYSSTRTVLGALAPRLGAGAVLLFDEYFNYPNWRHHEFRAFQEFVREFAVRYRYIAYSAKNCHVAVMLTAVGKNG
ncbi:MAG: class I SAM-dependent methyltransferase [Alphaproteobacteria bacterium]|nr:class I SAM-dependent methyltransferase [Alphaproteobacteria bacterium]